MGIWIGGDCVMRNWKGKLRGEGEGLYRLLSPCHGFFILHFFSSPLTSNGCVVPANASTMNGHNFHA